MSTMAYNQVTLSEKSYTVLDLETERRLHYENEVRYPEIAPHTCSICRNIVLRISEYAESFSKGPLGRELPGQPATVFTVIDAIRGAAAGCHFLVSMASGRHKLPVYVEQCRKERDLDTFNVHSDPATKHEMWWSLFKGKRATELSISHRPANQVTDGEGSPLESLNIYKLLGTARAPSFLSSSWLTPNLVPDSNLTYTRAKRWLSICEQNHSSCADRIAPGGPKRLLFIGDDCQTVSLSSTADAHRYAVLSYCWGGDQPFKTIEANVRSYEASIPLDKLGMTIRDAIIVTYRMGLRFLWVDALCIVQDDQDEMLDQLGKMKSIYTGAAFTILAASATTSAGGFLHRRREWVPSKLRCIDENEVESWVAVDWINKPILHPVLNRGWIFQEIQLSPRLMVFQTHSLKFICREQSNHNGHVVSEIEPVWVTNRGCASNKQHPEAWAEIVFKYSRLRLSNQNDKLPALGAMAQTYAQTHRVTEYHAGLWAEDLLWQLLWRRSGNSLPDPEKRRAEGVYYGPSWSWCSLPFHPSISMLNFYYPKDFVMLCSVQNVNVTPLSPIDPCGRVISAQLTLQGRGRYLTWVHGPVHVPWFSDTAGGDRETREGGGRAADALSEEFPDTLGIDPKLEIRLDEHHDWEVGSERPLLILHIGSYQAWHMQSKLAGGPPTHSKIHALVLQRINGAFGETLYERVGVLVAFDETWFSGGLADEMSITIV